MTTNSGSTIKWAKLIAGNQCNIESPLNFVIVNQEQFDSIWKKAFTMDMSPEKPVVDFTKNSVVALFSGMVNKGGHSVEIAAINQNLEKEFSIDIVNNIPGKNCISSMAIDYPYYLGLTDIIITGKTEFNSKTKEINCE
ncbi:MAG: protease complex subunit PrcB family protein [Bacteroidota bacterium]|nr:protease complex subunit PrcB family protein [Bacteroidota bacterium]